MYACVWGAGTGALQEHHATSALRTTQAALHHQRACSRTAHTRIQPALSYTLGDLVTGMQLTLSYQYAASIGDSQSIYRYTNIFEINTFKNPEPAKHNVTTSWQLFSNINNVDSRIDKPTVDKGTVHFLGVFNTTEQCFAAANASSKGPFHSFTFHTPEFGGEFASHCYGDTSFTWLNHEQGKINSGRGPGFPNRPSSNDQTFMFGRGGIQGGEGVTVSCTMLFGM